MAVYKPRLGDAFEDTSSETAPPDIETMRATASRVLGPDDGPGVLPPALAELDTLTATLRGHLELLVPEVEQAAGPRPRDVQTYCALACVGEARRKLSVAPRPEFESRVAHARRLAWSLNALCDHHERLGGAAS
ncbi:DUF6415 family natural product biosynthesis protein [Streptomyces dysideae]|uniref:Uncharacterized protein n=1 Tax=Streptomyces dysideae TaxID=909626 RepID=A0A117S0M1_9ACTN|nr:DUF6415 family natural product biosynthesis protein [Streptomyces dysideae]KUO19742.1 hypothetical protein AQJ91_18160 [Streptomyces dysideae]